MAQLQLPLFPVGATQVTLDLAFEKRDGQVTYFYSSLPVFFHAETDLASFKMITAQFYLSGYVKQMDIVRAFVVTPRLSKWIFMIIFIGFIKNTFYL